MTVDEVRIRSESLLWRLVDSGEGVCLELRARSGGSFLNLELLGRILARMLGTIKDTRHAPRRCIACDATLKVCNMTKVTSSGKGCCPDCNHPGPP